MKKLFALVLAALMCVSLVACGGDGEKGQDKEQTQAPTEAAKAEPFDAGNVMVDVAAGWKAFAVADVFAEDNAMDPNKISVIKGGESDWDSLTKPNMNILYYPPETDLMTPSGEWYDDSVDLAPMELGGRTWNGFTATSLGMPLAVLWTGESGGDQFQINICLELEGGSVSLEDADIQAMIASIRLP
ncbi:MAG: hypothetical protein E7437_09180 [Ruminococcaceae bacterium]|nr:hypothetical protein [Oscillospiraceae bacterium]